MSRNNGVKHLRYEHGGINTPEMEYWLIEHERTHKPQRRGDHDTFTTPELFAKNAGTETVLTLAIGTLVPKPKEPAGLHHLGGGLSCQLAPPNEDGLISVPPRSDMSRESFNRSEPTEAGGILWGYGGPPRRIGRISNGLAALMAKQDQEFEESIDRVRARHPDHCLDNSVVFIFQDAEFEIGKFLPNMGETRMLAAHHQFNLGVGRIKKFKAKKRKEKRRELKV
jgi:hypothetical protein